MKKRNEEDAKNLFIKYLQDNEGEIYETVDENVICNDGKRNFDYLLKSFPKKTIALEITQITKSTLVRRIYQTVIFQNFFDNLLDKNLLPSLNISVPSHTYMTDNKLRNVLKNNAKFLKSEFNSKSVALAVGESFFIEIPLSSITPLKITKFGINSNGFFCHSIGSFCAINESHEEAEISKQVADILEKKNKQLNCKADRKILLVNDSRVPVRELEKVLEATTLKIITQNKEIMANINEIFIIRNQGLHRIYST